MRLPLDLSGLSKVWKEEDKKDKEYIVDPHTP
jgi:hypothetical protein